MCDMPICPVCGEECNDFFVSEYGQEIVGCEHCIFMDSAHERTAKDREEARMDEYGKGR